jgi:exodeoxyribonuclease V alpha subunit
MNSVKDDVTIILCGDTQQLPSVGAGNVLFDVINTNLFEFVQLDVIYRQKKDSKIISFADCIKNGDIDEFIKDGKYKKVRVNDEVIGITAAHGSKDLQLIGVSSDKNISDIIIDKVENTFLNSSSKHFVNDILDIQILSSTKKGIAGTVELNKNLHNIFNKDVCGECNAHNYFFVGDKVMLTENNYDIGYCNGDIGIITEINTTKNTITVKINEENIEIPHQNIKDIVLSYANTIHKSQGSEYDYVIVALPKEPVSILQRNLIYTAITRAKKYVAVIYEDDALQVSVDKNKVLNRKTNLKNKILKTFKE